MTKIDELEQIETAITHAEHDLGELKRQVLSKRAYIGLLEQKRNQLIGNLDEVDTPNYRFTRENRHYDKPSNWRVSIVDKAQAIKDLEQFDQGLITPTVDLKKVKQLIANGIIGDQQFKSLAISKIEPKIKVKAKVN
ncbi:hypothetical protein BB562_07190 [Lactiplantibacillus pentosus]|uniref:Uncharacterized protein n=1 Tax=Lactiplantibacillus pentosus TaxID=1589 RepID=A0AAW8VS16_LACPE|nr:hypothetical protein [Lactiplantibacillus pentosus]AUI78482.1 hypothetical protein BB562_07190 [Lactiplantibacillus pentosus]MBU7474565.1 hypothetical protein [Lactiplantibacillus pentosus]MCT3278804.1 hypothetical protein [Lactiplantibacillus pentosus]MDT6988530.1 hypothetical protein [Lactiplantibacillus pentosus]MDT7000833.1 hypothetical protein [Lactiplantibacillus pentosus]